MSEWLVVVLLAIMALGIGWNLATLESGDDGRSTDAPGLTRGYGCC